MKTSPKTLKKIGIFVSATLFTAITLYFAAPIFGIHADEILFGTKKETKTLKEITTMQEMTAEICDATPVGETKNLLDLRNNSTYKISKLADGRCWTVENLRYADESLKSKNLVSDSKDNARGFYYNGTIAAEICPTGWNLPEREEFYNLALASNNLSSFNLAFAGLFSSEKMELISNDEKAFYWTGESDEKTITVVSISTNFELDSFKTPKLDTTTIRCIIPKTNESGTPTVIPETPAEETEAPTEEPTSQTEELNTSVKETEVKADEPENSATEAESTKETEETPEQENLPEN